MSPEPASLWFQTLLGLALLVVGVFLHLKWHPLRRQFSDAWDIMTQMPWLTLVGAALLLFAELAGEAWLSRPWSYNQLLDWRALAPGLAWSAMAEYARLGHGLLPPWPLALAFPPILSLLVWRIIRLPYRYGSQKQPVWERRLLLGSVVAAWLWAGLETAHAWRMLPEWLEALRLAARTAFTAGAMAFTQVVLVRLVIGWEEPVQPDDRRDVWLAVEHTFARWRGLGGLAALNLLWLLWHPPGGAPTPWHWLPVEAMLVFAAYPVAVARVPGPPLVQGAASMRALLRALAPQLAVLVTAVFMLMLVRYTGTLAVELATVAGWRPSLVSPVYALVLATVRNWVFLAGVLTLLRHGFQPSSAGREGAF